MTLLLYMVVLYGSVLTSALLTERYNRCLFNIRCALSDQREALVNERDATRYVSCPCIPLARVAPAVPRCLASLSHSLEGALVRWPPPTRIRSSVQ